MATAAQSRSFFHAALPDGRRVHSLAECVNRADHDTGSYTALMALFPTAAAASADGAYRNLTTAVRTSFTSQAACVSYTQDGS
jgi:hypothetical protein